MDEKLKKRIGENVESIWVSITINPNLNPDDPFERLKFDGGLAISKQKDLNVDQLYEYAWDKAREQVNAQIKRAKSRIELSRGKSTVSSPVPEKKNGNREASKAQHSMIESLRKQAGVKKKPLPTKFADASAEIDQLQKMLDEKSDAKF